VLATAVGGVRELIRDGVDGFVLPAGDAAAFARQARALLAEPARRERFRAAARERAEQFATPRMVETLARLYDELLHSGT